MAISWPTTPSVGTQVTGPNGEIWQWDGTKWIAVPSSGGGGGGGLGSAIVVDTWSALVPTPTGVRTVISSITVPPGTYILGASVLQNLAYGTISSNYIATMATGSDGITGQLHGLNFNLSGNFSAAFVDMAQIIASLGSMIVTPAEQTTYYLSVLVSYTNTIGQPPAAGAYIFAQPLA